MTVYVDTMRASYGRMKMCHMVADTLDELHAMAERLGVRQHFQAPPKASHPHYDVALSKRAEAIKAGAVEISMRVGLHYAAKLGVEWAEEAIPDLDRRDRVQASYIRTMDRTRRFVAT